MKKIKFIPLLALAGILVLAGCNSGKSLIVSDEVHLTNDKLYSEVIAEAKTNITLYLKALSATYEERFDSSYFTIGTQNIDYKENNFSKNSITRFDDAFVNEGYQSSESTNSSNVTTKKIYSATQTYWAAQRQDPSFPDELSIYLKEESMEDGVKSADAYYEIYSAKRLNAGDLLQEYLLDCVFQIGNIFPSESDAKFFGLVDSKTFVITVLSKSSYEKTNPAHPVDPKMNLIETRQEAKSLYFTKNSFGWCITTYNLESTNKVFTDYELNVLSEPVVISTNSATAEISYAESLGSYGTLPTYVASKDYSNYIPAIVSYDGTNYSAITSSVNDVTDAVKALRPSFDGIAYQIEATLDESLSYCFTNAENLSVSKYEIYGFSELVTTNLPSGFIVSKVTSEHAKLFSSALEQKYSFLYLYSANGTVSIEVSLA